MSGTRVPEVPDVPDLSEVPDDLRDLLIVFGPLPRHGPGTTALTQAILTETLELRPRLQPRRILDAGCGRGAASLALAEVLPDAAIVAIDLLAPSLAQLDAALAERGWTGRVTTLRGSMVELELDPLVEPFDLIWSEAAIYNVGVREALAAWAPRLDPEGAVVFSEVCWWVPEDQRPPGLVEWWREYPGMTDEAGVTAAITAAGFTCLARRRLPAAAWTHDFYDPLERRCAALRPVAASREDAGLLAAIDAAEAEIRWFRACHGRYGYTFFIAAPSPGA